MKRTLAMALVVGTLTVTGTATAATSGSARACEQLLDETTQAGELFNKNGDPLRSLNKNEKKAVAKAEQLTLESDHGFGEMAVEDDSLYLNECALPLFIDAEQEVETRESPIVANANHIPSTDTFKLHSNPNAKQTIYLDFDGHSVTNTLWNNSTILSSTPTPASFNATAWSADGDLANFSDYEREFIEDTWLHVAAYYSMFDIDVTTEAPPATALTKESASDQTFGYRALIGATPTIYNVCGCAGVAFLNINNYSYSNFNKGNISWVVANDNTPQILAGTIAHEVGHQLGLYHHGKGFSEYYSGHNEWAPIMGGASDRALTQWSDGSYAGANRAQEDVETINQNVPLFADEDGGGFTSAKGLTANTTQLGRLSTGYDNDYYRFSADGSVKIEVSAPANEINVVDSELLIYNAQKQLIHTTNSPKSLHRTNGVYRVEGLGATFEGNLARGEYYAVVRGASDDATPNSIGAIFGPYSAYGNAGRYNVSFTTSNVVNLPLTLGSEALGAFNQNEYLSYKNINASGGTPSYTYTITGLPSGLTYGPTTGQVSGKPTVYGTFPITAKVTDSTGTTAHTSYTLTINKVDPISITNTALGTHELKTQFYTQLTAKGGKGGYSWKLDSSGGSGITMTSYGELKGQLLYVGSFNVKVTVTDSSGNSLTKTLLLVVNPVKVDPPKPPPTPKPKVVKPKFNTKGTPNTKVKKAYNKKIVVASKKKVTWTVKGLPPGIKRVKLSAKNNKAIRLKGKAKKAGTYKVKITAKNSGGSTTKTYKIKVAKK